jgi:hypothetical protein
MSSNSAPAVGPTANVFPHSRPNARQPGGALGWFIAAYVLVSVCAMAIAADLSEPPGRPLTLPQSHHTGMAQEKSATAYRMLLGELGQPKGPRSVPGDRRSDGGMSHSGGE